MYVRGCWSGRRCLSNEFGASKDTVSCILLGEITERSFVKSGKRESASLYFPILTSDDFQYLENFQAKVCGTVVFRLKYLRGFSEAEHNIELWRLNYSRFAIRSNKQKRLNIIFTGQANPIYSMPGKFPQTTEMTRAETGCNAKCKRLR